jgi:hypothetical protein
LIEETPKELPNRVQRRLRSKRNLNVDRHIVDPEFDALVDYIKDSDFFRENKLEPTLGSPEGVAFFEGYPSKNIVYDTENLGKSIYYILVDESNLTCRLCGVHKGALCRVITCFGAPERKLVAANVEQSHIGLCAYLSPLTQ